MNSLVTDYHQNMKTTSIFLCIGAVGTTEPDSGVLKLLLLPALRLGDVGATSSETQQLSLNCFGIFCQFSNYFYQTKFYFWLICLPTCDFVTVVKHFGQLMFVYKQILT